MPIRFDLKINQWLPENFGKYDLCFHSHNLIFFNIPKNASSSVRISLGLEGTRQSFFEIKNREQCKKLMVIRNPYDRIISIFNEVIKCRKDGPRKETLQCEWFSVQKNNLKAGFKMFLDYIDNRLYDPHTHRQADFLNAKKTRLEEIDFLFLFEDLRREINTMPNELKRQKKFPHINSSKNRSTQNNLLKNLINTDIDIKDKIEKIYKDDIILYQKVLKIKAK